MTRADRISTYGCVPHYLAELLVIVANAHNITLAELRGPSRKKHLVRARREFCAMARAIRDERFQGHYRFSLPQIGRALNRDHTTVIHALKAVEKSRQMAHEKGDGQLSGSAVPTPAR